MGVCETRDDCPVVPGEWRWRVGGEEEGGRGVCAGECLACLGKKSWVRFAGDSNCRDIYVEAVSCVLEDIEPDVPAARVQPETQTKFKSFHPKSKRNLNLNLHPEPSTLKRTP